MKHLFWGPIIFSLVISTTPSRVRRFSGGGEWNWNRSEQLTDQQQTKGGSPPAGWPPKGNNGNSVKGGRGDADPGRDWGAGDPGKQPQGNSKGSAYPDGEGGDLETILRGVPGVDYPNLAAVPKTGFDCAAHPSQGYYGDVEAGCQVFHICQPGNRKDSFICPVGTIFNQKYFVCDWWFNVNCSDTPSFYELNNEVYGAAAVASTTPAPVVTTDKPLPWNAQDLDKKRPPAKSWNGNQPANGKKSNGWSRTDVQQKESNGWSRTDVQQKEVTVAWGSSGGTPQAPFGSPSTASNTLVPTAKPVWYGIDGQPDRDQSDDVAASRRQGAAPTPAAPPFGTRMKSGTRAGRAHDWATTEPYPQTTAQGRGSSAPQVWIGAAADDDGDNGLTGPPVGGDSDGASRGWFQGGDGVSSREASLPPSPTTPAQFPGGWSKEADDFPGIAGTTAGWRGNELPSEDGGYAGTDGWPRNGAAETSIVPSDTEGVWEQQTSRRRNIEDLRDDGVDRSGDSHQGVWRQDDNRRSFFDNRITDAYSRRDQSHGAADFSFGGSSAGIWHQGTPQASDSSSQKRGVSSAGIWQQGFPQASDSLSQKRDVISRRGDSEAWEQDDDRRPSLGKQTSGVDQRGQSRRTGNINFSGGSDAWRRETARRSDSPNQNGQKIDNESQGSFKRRQLLRGNRNVNVWGQRRSLRKFPGASDRGWVKQEGNDRKSLEDSLTNGVATRKWN